MPQQSPANSAAGNPRNAAPDVGGPDLGKSPGLTRVPVGRGPALAVAPAPSATPEACRLASCAGGKTPRPCEPHAARGRAGRSEARARSRQTAQHTGGENGERGGGDWGVRGGQRARLGLAWGTFAWGCHPRAPFQRMYHTEVTVGGMSFLCK